MTVMSPYFLPSGRKQHMGPFPEVKSCSMAAGYASLLIESRGSHTSNTRAASLTSIWHHQHSRLCKVT